MTQPPTPVEQPAAPPGPASEAGDAAAPNAAQAPVAERVVLNDGTEFRLENGRLVIQDETGATTTLGYNANEVIPPEVPVIIGLAFSGIIGIILAFPIGRAIARWIDRRGYSTPVDAQLVNRLTAIEQAVDTVAIEVERMSEANRFTTRLLTERVGAPDFTARAPGAADRAHADHAHADHAHADHAPRAPRP
ncbi:MAG TPA: hypothetical protein PKE51_09975 [Gemmatimonadaceae bacterium]|nr:hypothetical protein [Gemmatimonadaceae bacterium]